MGASSFNEGDPSRAVWAVCGQETGEGLESSPLMPLLDGLEGKKQVAGSISEDLTRESTLWLSGDGNDSACNLSAIKPETPTEAPQEDCKTNAVEGIMECPLSGNIGESPMALIEQKTDAMENEEKNVDRKLLEIAVSPNENAGETSEAGLKSEKTDEKTLDPVEGDVIVQSEEDQTDGRGAKISPTCLSLDPKSVEQIDASADTAHDQVDTAQGTCSASGGDLVEVCKAKGEENENILVIDGKLLDTALSTSEDARETSEVGSKSEKIDVKPLDPVAVDGIVEVKEDQSGGVVFKSSPRDLSPGLKSIEQTDTSADTACIQDDAAQGSYLVTSGDLVDSFKAKGEENEAVLSEPDGYGDNTTVPVSEENHFGIQSRQLAGCTGPSLSDVQAFEDNLKQDDVCRNPTVPVEGEAGVSEIKGPHDSSKESLEVWPENATMVLPDTMVSPIDTEICQKTNLVDNNSGGDHEKARIENFDMAGSNITEGATEGNLTENRKTASECVSTVANSQANQTINLLEGDSAGDLEYVKIETCEIAGRKAQKDLKRKILHLEVTVLVIMTRNLPETENKDLYEVSDPSRVEIDITETHSCLQNQDKGSQGLDISKHDEIKVQCLGAVCGVAESNLDGEKLTQNAENLSMQKTGDFESSVQCLTTVEEDHTQMLGGEASGISSSMKEPVLSSGDAESSVQSSVAVEDDCTGLLAGDASGISSSTKEPKLLSVDAESSVQRSTTAVEDDQTKVLGGNGSGVKSETLQVESDNNIIDRQLGVLPLDVSIDSGSQTDSLEGNWVLFQPPSFATLVEPGGGGNGLKSAHSEIQTVQSQQQPNSASSQAGWFPSLTNVVNESQGRKKNEEVIAKVTNWSTGKQHTPLKNLLVEANTETKLKSPTPKGNSASVTQKDEAPAKNGSATPPTKVNSIPGPEAPTTEPAKDLGQEWNSPARTHVLSNIAICDRWICHPTALPLMDKASAGKLWPNEANILVCDNQQSSGEIQSHVIDSLLHLSYITTSNSSVALALGVAGPWLRCENAVPSTHPESKPICIPWPSDTETDLPFQHQYLFSKILINKTQNPLHSFLSLLTFPLSLADSPSPLSHNNNPTKHTTLLVETLHENERLGVLIQKLSNKASSPLQLLRDDGDWNKQHFWAVIRFLKDASRSSEILPVFHLWKDMDKSRINEFNYAKIIGLLSQEDLAEESVLALEEMKTHGLKPSLEIYNLVIHCFARKGEFDRALYFLNELKENNLIADTETYDGLIQSYGKYKMYDELDECVKKMESDGCLPDHITYNLLIQEFFPWWVAQKNGTGFSDSAFKEDGFAIFYFGCDA
ncbi:Pentatricopeptide repeat-containing protein, chloroplastic [Vitis vinifera]|uniref:Pentatricopeptide repeat-containing protein, chloroplastic n=1 Tax=Vitis vinifera TaxID=29760 RepID=A0A438FW25_VITVI|nr:Pentatricopeptide repeat-containing protein, chloroplastic [Vitis vinifera]